MRIAVAGTPRVALPVLDWLLRSEHEMVLVISQPDRKSGRGQSASASPVKQWALDHNISCVTPEHSAELAPLLSDIDCVVTVAYGVLLPLNILNIPTHGFVNVHFSLLPQWRGAAPVQRGILHGDTKTGVTVFKLEAGMDTGPIYAQQEMSILENETSGDLLDRLASKATTVLGQALQMIEAGNPPIPQSSFGISYAPKFSKTEAAIHWTDSAERIHATVRAFTPEPGAWSTWRDVSIGINECQVFAGELQLEPGELVMHAGKVLVGCSSSCLEVIRVTPSGKRTMNASEWFNGARWQPGDRFE